MMSVHAMGKCISQGYVSRQFFHHYNFITLSTNVFHETKFREILLLIKTFVRKHSGHQFYFCTLRKWHNKPTCVLYWACTLLLIRSISRNVSSLPCFTSKSCHAFQKWAVNCKKLGNNCKNQQYDWFTLSDIEHKLNVHKTIKRHLLNVFCTFNLCSVSRR